LQDEALIESELRHPDRVSEDSPTCNHETSPPAEVERLVDAQRAKLTCYLAGIPLGERPDIERLPFEVLIVMARGPGQLNYDQTRVQ
jgi:hypothetical protein